MAKKEEKMVPAAELVKMEKKLAAAEKELVAAQAENTSLQAALVPVEAPKPELPAEAPKITELPGGCIRYGGHPDTAQTQRR